eukprot:NODE_3284_length_2060_cov_9.941542.p1 GENE.NODE_3284_length_2060_cov_9.941542~~NODE_3284_length_2060_cov_9.941542.p1  ORF type:complete len:571 (-),score=143.66 NODE_3284_length_2060_cov_9.941542:348-1808(-)
MGMPAGALGTGLHPAGMGGSMVGFAPGGPSPQHRAPPPVGHPGMVRHPLSPMSRSSRQGNSPDARYSLRPAGSMSPHGSGVASGVTSVGGGCTPPMFEQPMHGGMHGEAVGQMRSESPRRWQDAYLELDRDKRRVRDELRDCTEEASDLARKAHLLREQIHAEQERRRDCTSDMSRQLENLEYENKQLQMKLMKVQMQDSAKHADATTVKKEVVAKTMELEKTLREFQQSHQERLFSRVWSVTAALLAISQKPDLSLQIQLPSATEESLLPSPTPPLASATVGAVDDAAAASGVLDLETQQALRQRLQSLGDVVAYTGDKFEACCASGRAILPGALRVRPRRCDHVFLVECLIPYWAEGRCPVCRCSFAYGGVQDFDESDKYSSVSASVSQRGGPRPLRGSSCSDNGSLVLSSAMADRRRRSPSHGLRSRHNKPLPRSSAGGSLTRGAGGSAALSPPRSTGSLRSRASSVPPQRGSHTAEPAARPL